MAVTDKEWCYYVPAGQDPKEHGGYVPSLVVAGEAGHSPMVGQGPHAAPWVWGKTLVEAQEVCSVVNEGRGVTDEAADLIVASSMRAGNEVAP